MFRSSKAFVLLLAAFALGGYCHAQNFPCSSRTPIIIEDDNKGDPDGMESFYQAIKWQDWGCAQLLAMVADSPYSGFGIYSAPAMEAELVYAKHPEIPVGANLTSAPTTDTSGSANGWVQAVVTQFRPGDVGANYPACAATYRKALAHATTNSVVIVLTGYTPCLLQMLATGADSISPLTGVQLAQQKAKEIVVVAGYWSVNDPAQPEFNAVNDRVGYNTLLATWTSQNGYPPMYFVDFFDAIYANSGPATYASTTVDPSLEALVVGNVDCVGYGTCVQGRQRPTWGQIGILFAVWGAAHNGTTYYTLSANGTGTINASTGDSSFSTGTASGQYVLTMSTTVTAQLQNLLDCYSPAGSDAGSVGGSYAPCAAPLVGTGSMTTANVHGSVTEK